MGLEVKDLTDEDRLAIMNSVIEALPTDLVKEGAEADVDRIWPVQDVTVRFNDNYSFDKPTITVMFSWPVEGKGKTWPVRKDKTVNAEAMADYIEKTVRRSRVKQAKQEEGGALSRRAAKRIEQELNEDDRVKALGFLVKTTPIYREVDGRVMVEFCNPEENEHGYHDEICGANYYPKEDRYRFTLRGTLTRDQLLSVLEIVNNKEA